MLDGVTILSTTVKTVATSGVGFWTTFFLFIAVLVVVEAITEAIKERDLEYIFMGLLLITGLIMFTGVAFSFEGPEIEYNIYKVTIDDSVNMNEFTQRYEIISQEGLIYEIKEKVDSD